MNLGLFTRPALRFVARAAEFLFDRFIRRPLRGLTEVSEALALLVPDLAEATATAVVRAVGAQLTLAGQSRVRQGLRLLRWGLKQMAWPIGLVVAVLLFQLPGGFWLLSVTALVLLATFEPSGPSVRLMPMP